MVRDISIIVIILIIVIASDLVIGTYLDKTSKNMVGELGILKEKTLTVGEDGNRKEIESEVKRIEDELEKIINKWSTVVMHQEIDNIEQALVKAKSSIEHGKIEDAIPEIDTAIFFVEHVNKREKINFKNIF